MKFGPLLILVVLLAYTYFAYVTVDKSDALIAKKENNQLKQELQAEKEARTKDRQDATSKIVNLHNTLVTVIPAQQDIINNVFGGKPTTQPVK